MIPSVNITELDGALGILPPTAGKLLVVVGTASQGPLNTPATFGRVSDLTSTFGTGPGVEAAARHIEQTGKPVVFVRTGETVTGAAGTVDSSDKTGTSAVTADVVTDQPLDDYEVVFTVVLGGTIGTGPITFTTSLDGGRTTSANTSLGTANTYTIPDSGVVIDFAAGTLVTGDVVTFRTSAPKWNSTELGTALDALALTSITWEIAEIVGAIDATAFDLLETKFSGMFNAGRRKLWLGNCRVPTIGESEATYLAAMTAIFSSKASLRGALCFGAAQVTSSVNGRAYMRPVSFVAGSLEAAASAEVNTAAVNRGTITGVSIKDGNGNPLHHDEALSPGADDARFYTLRTHNNLAGVYVNRPKLFSPQGSDFDLIPHRRVMNIGEDVLDAYMLRRLNSPIQVDKTTGYILAHEREEIEAGAEAALQAALFAAPMVSDVSVVLSQFDNLISSKTLTGDMRLVPLGYPETINLKAGFSNPANQLQAA